MPPTRLLQSCAPFLARTRVFAADSTTLHALLLDEPTSHLDVESIHWLREFLVRYDGSLIVISHDRHFLNSVCTHIADIDYQTIDNDQRTTIREFLCATLEPDDRLSGVHIMSAA